MGKAFDLRLFRGGTAAFTDDQIIFSEVKTDFIEGWNYKLTLPQLKSSLSVLAKCIGATRAIGKTLKEEYREGMVQGVALNKFKATVQNQLKKVLAYSRGKIVK